MKIEIRDAVPNDASIVCPLIYSAGVQVFDYMFAHGGMTAMDYIEYAFKEGDGFLGHKTHVVAAVDGITVGIGAFYSGFEYKGFEKASGNQIMAFYSKDVWSEVFQRCSDILSITPPIDDHTEYISDLGVEPEMRGKGVGTALLDHQKEVAISKNRRIFALDVAVTNPRAQKLYERMGFRVMQENKFVGTRQSPKVPDSRRMEMRLDKY